SILARFLMEGSCLQLPLQIGHIRKLILPRPPDFPTWRRPIAQSGILNMSTGDKESEYGKADQI
ncbi:MAG TPA: hypothetical protein VE860_00900, partial [Chthoniobacterales bacterium]|nr:hypothetical protein [Chthoniobacterales bacterium]